MVKKIEMDHKEIEHSLIDLQDHFDCINKKLSVKREPLRDDIIKNMLSAYHYLEEVVNRQGSLFSNEGQLEMLELNHVVLCGEKDALGEINPFNPKEARVLKRTQYYQHIMATQKKFYDNSGQLMTWYRQHHDESVWKRAAGIYVRTLIQPQLFIEGNHRTGSLYMSYTLMREGKPPFVLSKENAVAYFEPSSLVKQSDRRDWKDKMRMPGFRKKFRELLKEQSDKGYLK